MDRMVAGIARELAVSEAPAETRTSLLIPLLREIQGRVGNVPAGLARDIGRVFGIPDGQVLSVATFFPAFDVTGADTVRPRSDAERWLEELVGVSFDQVQAMRCPVDPHPIETRRILARAPGNEVGLAAYVASGGYRGLATALSMVGGDLIDLVGRSGLRGMGGAAFPTAAKWRFAREAAGSPKYLVCNAAEGDLGAGMDATILRSDPHAVIEGMAIAALAIGAANGVLFLRSEYDGLAPVLRSAIAEAEADGRLDGFSIEVTLAAGRYVCGEETSLLNTLEGRAGRPRRRPPFPAQAGLWGKPTVINNVKTLAALPLILRHGADWFAQPGAGASRGTAIVGLTGHVTTPGIAEVPMGTRLIDIVNGPGGGVADGRALKAVQTGGPLGGLVPAAGASVAVTHEDMGLVRSPLGSGGMIVVADGTCMVAFARCFARFCTEETCGYCTPCRLGTVRIDRLLRSIMQGDCDRDVLDRIDSAAIAVRQSSFCAFGAGAPGVVASAIGHFRQEFEEHVVSGRCPTGDCSRILAMEGGE